MAEEIFFKHLLKFGKIESEESGVVGNGEFTITLDPFDGSDNFRSNFPYFGSSVALEIDGDVKVGVVTNFATGVFYLRYSDTLEYSSLDTLKFYKYSVNPHASIGIFERSHSSKKYAKMLRLSEYKYRTPGAIAISLALASQVQFFIYEGDMRSYDIKAALFISKDLYKHKEKDLTIICSKLNHFESLKKILL